MQLQEVNEYKWKVGLDTGFAAMLSYAWYLYIENKLYQYRGDATRCLKNLVMASEAIGIEKKPIDAFIIDDFLEIKKFLKTSLGRSGSNLTLLFLLKYLSILREKKLLSLNVIDVAARMS